MFDLRENYKTLNYSLVDIDMHINKIFTYPIYLMLMTILSSIIMFNSKSFKKNTFKIVIGLFFSVIVYYISNFFNVMGTTEKIPLLFAIWTPLLIIALINSVMLTTVNDK